MLCAVTQNYEFIFITPHNNEYASKLKELILIATEAKDLRKIVETIEYLGEFKQNLIDSVSEHSKLGNSDVSSILNELQNATGFCDIYLKMLQILHQKSKIITETTNINGMQVTTEKDGEDQEEEVGMSTVSFR